MGLPKRGKVINRKSKISDSSFARLPKQEIENIVNCKSKIKTVFRREVKDIKELVMRNLRQQGLEMPLLQKRLVEAWPVVAGEAIGRYTLNAWIQNQTLYVKLSSPALRADLSMRRAEFVALLNQYVDNQVIADIRFC